jgi:biotin operon repressor
VLLVLAEYADAHGENSYPSQANIADRLGLTAGDVSDALAALREQGVIVKTAEAIPRKRGATYRLPYVADYLDSLGEPPSELPSDSLGGLARGTHSGNSLGGFTRGTHSGNPRVDPDPEPEPEPDDDREIVARVAPGPRDPDEHALILGAALDLAEKNSPKRPWSAPYRAGVEKRVTDRVDELDRDEWRRALALDTAVLAKVAGVTPSATDTSRAVLARVAAGLLDDPISQAFAEATPERPVIETEAREA